MALPARRLTELNTWRGPTRSSSSTGGTTTTMIRRLEEGRREPGFLDAGAMRPLTLPPRGMFRKQSEPDGGFRRICVRNRRARLPYDADAVGGDLMQHRWLGIVGTALLLGAVLPPGLVAQAERGPYARIAVLRPHDGK